MADIPKPAAPIVAELGRAETPLETAARKAESSRKHRANQTLRNLVLALVASLGAVLVLVLVVVRPEAPPRTTVDYRQHADTSQVQAGQVLAAPPLPAGWSANHDNLSTGSDSVVSWSIGFITPSGQYIELVQGIKANPTWVAGQLNNRRVSGQSVIAGQSWSVYDHRNEPDQGNYAYSLSTVLGTNSIVLHGTATTAEFKLLATAIAAQLAASSSKTSTGMRTNTDKGSSTG